MLSPSHKISVVGWTESNKEVYWKENKTIIAVFVWIKQAAIKLAFLKL